MRGGDDPNINAQRLLTADTLDAINSFDKPDTVSPRPYRVMAQGGKLHFRLPPRSVAVLQVR